MKISSQESWDKWVANNTDGYGSAIIRYAEAWANLMEAKIAEGSQLEDIAQETSHEADTEGITGYMYGAAVSVLASSWIYGEQLRLWHNGKYKRFSSGEDNGGVVNPAILNIHTSKG